MHRCSACLPWRSWPLGWRQRTLQPIKSCYQSDLADKSTHTLALTAQVSHDQYLIEATVDELWMCEDGRVTPFHGTFDEYKKRLRSMNKH